MRWDELFNNWLKRRDKEVVNEQEELEEFYESDAISESLDIKPLEYDEELEEQDDDYYYYYYYEGSDTNNSEPTIPELEQENNNIETELYDSTDNVYVSPYDDHLVTTNDSKESDDLYESDPNIEERMIAEEGSDKLLLLENEMNQLREQLERVMIENDTLRQQSDETKKLAENNQQLMAQLDEYSVLMEENQNIQLQLLDLEALKEENDSLNKELESTSAKALAQEVELTEIKARQSDELLIIMEQVSSLSRDKREMAKQFRQLQELKEQEVTEKEEALSVATATIKEQENLLNERDQKLIETEQRITELSQSLNDKEMLLETNSMSQVALDQQGEALRLLESDKQTLETENGSLKDSLASSESANEKLKEENKQLITTLTVLETELQEFKIGTTEQLAIADLQRTIKELEDELSQSKALETTLIKEYEEKILIYQKDAMTLESREQELSEMNEQFETQLSQTEKLEKELAELKENQQMINQLERELSDMKVQQERVASSLTDLQSAPANQDTLALQQELARVKEELRMANLRAEQQPGTMHQSDIAQVMLEAQAKARQIVDVANYEAKRKVADAEMELSAVSQEARNYYRKLEKIKSESEVVFSELLRKLETMGDIDRL